MQTNCCYALQDKTWVHDPDGNEWEVFVVLEDNLAQTAACCGTGAIEATDAQATASANAGDAAAVNTKTEAVSCCGAQPQAVGISGLAR
jgi:hypothetical protein